MIDDRFVFFAISLNAIGSISYVMATVRGLTRPNRVTWFLWALAPMVAFAAQLDEGVGKQALLTFMVGFGPLLILIASFVNPQSQWKVTRFDLICGGLSLLGLALWLVTREGWVGIALAIAADALAGVPTVRKAWTNPETEHPLVFLLAATSAAITLLTLDTWSFESAAFAVYILVICGLLAALAIRPGTPAPSPVGAG